jgi:hypothetical protein
MAANKIPFGEDPLDRRHRAGGLAEPCPECGARPRPGDNRCWFCESKRLPLAGFEPVTGKDAADPLGASYPPRSGLQFSLGTMLLVTTLVAICLAIMMAAPLLGIALSVIAVGGLLRTAIVGSARIRAGGRFEFAEKIDEFAVSSTVFVTALVLGLSTTTVIAGCVLFLTGVLAEFVEPFGLLYPIAFLAAIPFAVIAGIFVFAKLYLTFDPAVREQIAATPEQQRLNQMSGTVYRHRPK